MLQKKVRGVGGKSWTVTVVIFCNTNILFFQHETKRIQVDGNRKFSRNISWRTNMSLKVSEPNLANNRSLKFSSAIESRKIS